jgi:hypothetical protein
MWLTPKHQCLEGGSCCIISERNLMKWQEMVQIWMTMFATQNKSRSLRSSGEITRSSSRYQTFIQIKRSCFTLIDVNAVKAHRTDNRFLLWFWVWWKYWALLRQVLVAGFYPKHWDVRYIKMKRDWILSRIRTFMMSEDHEYNESEDEAIVCRQSWWYRRWSINGYVAWFA